MSKKLKNLMKKYNEAALVCFYGYDQEKLESDIDIEFGKIEKIKEYAQHLGLCDRYNNLSDEYYDEIGKPCTCGLVEMLKKV